MPAVCFFNSIDGLRCSGSLTRTVGLRELFHKFRSSIVAMAGITVNTYVEEGRAYQSSIGSMRQDSIHRRIVDGGQYRVIENRQQRVQTTTCLKCTTHWSSAFPVAT